MGFGKVQGRACKIAARRGLSIRVGTARWFTVLIVNDVFQEAQFVFDYSLLKAINI